MKRPKLGDQRWFREQELQALGLWSPQNPDPATKLVLELLPKTKGNVQEAILAMLISDVPLSNTWRRAIEGLLRRYFFLQRTDPKRHRREVQKGKMAIAKETKRHLKHHRDAQVARQAEQIVAQMNNVTVTALRKRLQRALKTEDKG